MKRIHILLISLVVLVAWFTYTPAAVNLPFSLIKLLMSEDHTNVGSRTLSSGKKIKLPLDNDGTEPTICFDGGDGDCDDGIWLSSDGNMSIGANKARVVLINATGLLISGANSAILTNEAASATNSTLVPNRANLDTGFGSPADGQVSAIGDDKEITRWDGTAASGASVWTDGGIVIGDISGATVTPISGLTSFLLIISGVSPAGGSGGSPVNAIELYVTGNELFVADGNGTHTGLGSFNLQTGQATSKKWNVYTGKIVTRNWETGAVTVDSGTTRDWKVDQIANQKRAHIRSYTQQVIEVPQGQATKFGDIEIEDKLWWTVKYRFERGKKVEYNAYAKRVVKNKEKVLKPNHWMDEDGTFWRRRTKPEAIAAYAVDMASIGNKWDNLAPFLKAEIQDPRL